MTDRRIDSRRHWLLSNAGILTATVVVAVFGIAALTGMFLIAGSVTGGERARLQIDALKYGLGVFAAAGAVAALLLAVRRQLLAEEAHDLSERNHQIALKAQAHTETDAAERRVTDLYTKAVEQLGSADAAVRLGGLYALERVAQNNPAQRQTIVNVLCAYLRMPYTPPAVAPPAMTGPVTGLPLPRTAPAASRDPQQELQVRLTSQRILTTHLNLPQELTAEQAHALPPTADQPFWPGIDLDLTGAHLADWTMRRSHVHQANFTRATFTGDASFNEATFTGDVLFDEATFTGDAWFGEVAVAGGVWFRGATFTGKARFRGATFTGDVSFGWAAFTGDVSFSKATFTGDAWFGEATFTGDARFDDVAVAGDVWFRGAAFAGKAWFRGAAFAGEASFGEATFTGDVSFGGATFTGDVSFREATFEPGKRLIMAKAQVTLGEDQRNVWPPGWRVDPDSSSGWGRLVPEAPGTPV